MRRADLLTFVALAALLVGVAFTSPRWSRLLRRPVRVADEDVAPPSAVEPPGPASAAAPVTRTINVKLFFEDAQGNGLVLEERSVPYRANLAQQLQAVVDELLRGSQAGNLSPLAGGAHVLDVFVTARGVAYVDVSKEIAAGQIPGSRAELLAVYSLIDSISLNFPAVKRVQESIGGPPVRTEVHRDNLGGDK